MKAELTFNTFVYNGITCLGETYVTSPFKLMNITEDKKAKKLHLMVMSSSPGVLDEDEYNINISVTENGALQLHTQSYQRIFNMQNGAKQNMEIHLAKGATFVYLPHPSVPHEQSIFKASNKIYLQDNSSLIWAEILTCGRKLNGEIFQYAKYHSITDIYLNDKLIIKENLFMQPALINPVLLGQMEGFTHQGSMIVLGGDRSNTGISQLDNSIIEYKEGDRREEIGDRRNTGIKQFDNSTIDNKESRERIKELAYKYLSTIKEISFGVSTTPADGMIVRILGFKAEQLHDIFKHIATLIQY